MKNWKAYIIAIPSVVILGALFGFIISYASASQVAYARLFIDAGVIAAVISFCMALPRPKDLPTHIISDGLRDLARCRYDTRISDTNLGELSEIAQAFNELAGTLSDTVDPPVKTPLYKVPPKIIRAQERPFVESEHSYHPELGPVLAAPSRPLQTETKAAVEKNLPAAHTSVDAYGLAVNSISQEQPPLPPPLPEPSYEDRLFDLYDAYAKALHTHSQEIISFDTFKETIDKTRKDLMAAHHCSDVHFEVVTEGDEIALRPRLLR